MTALVNAIQTGMLRGFVAVATVGVIVWVLDRMWRR